MNRGIATFTLDYGICPKWLFDRMVKLGRSINEVIIAQFGPDEFVRRISDPVWFQSLGTVLAFDWNASGLTTILTAALKEAIRGQEKDLGVFICGGKGKTSRKTPDEIMEWGEKLNLPVSSVNNLVYNSRMSAKVDSALLQDGFQIYHHSFFFSKNGAWAVVQQGMNTQNQTARRYHWFSDDIEDLVLEPHSAIVSQLTSRQTLDMTSLRSLNTQKLSVDLILSGLKNLTHDIDLLRKHSSSLSKSMTVRSNDEMLSMLKLYDTEFNQHPVELENFFNSKYLMKILSILCDEKPHNYEKLLARKGVGPKTIRALSLVAEVMYGAKPSYEDPARYSFAHGGKDATPYPVDKITYDHTIETLKEVVRVSKINPYDKDKAINRLTKADITFKAS